MLSKLSTLLPAESPLRPCLERSLPQPFAYPPPYLSKLVPGHEAFATKEVICLDDDGLTNIDVDATRVAEAFQSFPRDHFVMVKKEYSRNSAGVRLCSSGSQAVQHVRALMQRQGGVAAMDLDLKVRIFMQQAVAHCRSSFGTRFYAQNGRILALQMSKVVNFSRKKTYHYVTLHDPQLQELAVNFTRAINYTGFGAAWWCQSAAPAGFNLIDFNPRIERHACLHSVLSADQKPLDPCYLFQQIVRGQVEPSQVVEPRVVPAGIFYFDPIRMGELQVTLKGEERDWTRWNVVREDALLWESVKAGIKRSPDHDEL
jgi:hypothetical protein